MLLLIKWILLVDTPLHLSVVPEIKIQFFFKLCLYLYFFFKESTLEKFGNPEILGKNIFPIGKV